MLLVQRSAQPSRVLHARCWLDKLPAVRGASDFEPQPDNVLRLQGRRARGPGSCVVSAVSGRQVLRFVDRPRLHRLSTRKVRESARPRTVHELSGVSGQLLPRPLQPGSRRRRLQGVSAVSERSSESRLSESRRPFQPVRRVSSAEVRGQDCALRRARRGQGSRRLRFCCAVRHVAGHGAVPVPQKLRRRDQRHDCRDEGNGGLS